MEEVFTHNGAGERDHLDVPLGQGSREVVLLMLLDDAPVARRNGSDLRTSFVLDIDVGPGGGLPEFRHDGMVPPDKIFFSSNSKNGPSRDLHRHHIDR